MNITQENQDTAMQRVRNLSINVYLLNSNMQTINQLSGKVIAGNISIDANSDIRRTCNIDMVITIDAVHGKLDLNSVRCSSQLNITSSCLFNTITKGIKTKIIYAGDIDEDSGNQIELNGIMSELVIKAD